MLVIGAGKMGELTLRHLKALKPRRILVTNRSPDKARQVAATAAAACRCRGSSSTTRLVAADIILSTTGAPEPDRDASTLPADRAARARDATSSSSTSPCRATSTPASCDGDRDLPVQHRRPARRPRARSCADRGKHVAAAEAIVKAEQERFLKEWTRRRAGPAIARLNQDWDAIRRDVQAQCFSKLNGKLTPEEQAVIEGAFKLLQNKLMHAPSRRCARKRIGRGGMGCWRRFISCFGCRSEVCYEFGAIYACARDKAQAASIQSQYPAAFTEPGEGLLRDRAAWRSPRSRAFRSPANDRAASPPPRESVHCPISPPPPSLAIRINLLGRLDDPPPAAELSGIAEAHAYRTVLIQMCCGSDFKASSMRSSSTTGYQVSVCGP